MQANWIKTTMKTTLLKWNDCNGRIETCQGKPHLIGLDNNENRRQGCDASQRTWGWFSRRKNARLKRSHSWQPRWAALDMPALLQIPDKKPRPPRGTNILQFWEEALKHYELVYSLEQVPLGYLPARSTWNERTQWWSFSYQTEGLVWRHAHLITCDFWDHLASRRSSGMMRNTTHILLNCNKQVQHCSQRFKARLKGALQKLERETSGETSQRRMRKPLEICR